MAGNFCRAVQGKAGCDGIDILVSDGRILSAKAGVKCTVSVGDQGAPPAKGSVKTERAAGGQGGRDLGQQDVGFRLRDQVEMGWMPLSP